MMIPNSQIEPDPLVAPPDFHIGASLIREIEKSACSESLSTFLKRSWDELDPGEPYQHNWHMDAICEHLQAVADGQLTRLLINVPPGTSKSSATCVYFPAWLWGPGGKAHWRVISSSFSQDNALRDTRKTRLLVESDWFQERWPLQMARDQNAKGYFENTEKGFRQASAVTGITGKRGNIIVWDDPLNPESANSDVERTTANRIFAETLTTRLIDPATSSIIIVMQRLHEQDVSGHILENDLGYEHLCLPMEFEPERKCYTSIGFEDPRTEDGELLHPDRFPDWVIERDKKALGSYAYAGQNQQRPTPRGGGLFKTHWFEVVEAAPNDCKWVRGWDFAATRLTTAAWTRGVLIGRSRSTKNFYVKDVVGVQGTPGEVKQLLKMTAVLDGREVYGSIPQDPGQAGKAQVADMIAELAGYNYTSSTETGDKITRAEPVAAQAEAGNVKIVKGTWNQEFLDELSSFPTGKFADQVDALSRGFGYLVMEPMHTEGMVDIEL